MEGRRLRPVRVARGPMAGTDPSLGVWADDDGGKEVRNPPDLPAARERLGLAGNPDRASDAADQRADRAPERPCEGPFVPTRPAQDGRKALLAAEVPPESQPRRLPGDNSATRTAQVRTPRA